MKKKGDNYLKIFKKDRQSAAKGTRIDQSQNNVMCPLLDILRDPLEAISIPHFAHNAAHEHLDRTNIRVREVYLPFAGSDAGQTQVVGQLFFGCCIWDIDLVAQYQEGNIGQRVIREKGIELFLRLCKPLLVVRVH